MFELVISYNAIILFILQFLLPLMLFIFAIIKYILSNKNIYLVIAVSIAAITIVYNVNSYIAVKNSIHLQHNYELQQYMQNTELPKIHTPAPRYDILKQFKPMAQQEN